jgi:osmotically-inducible protein OsmY
MGELPHTTNSTELAESRLRRSAYLALQHVCCEVRAGVLILRGTLHTYYLKQVAHAVVATVEGVQRIDNQIEVVTHARSSSEQGLTR